MSNKKNKVERTYSTTLLEAEQPIDLRVFCELIAARMLSDEKFIKKGAKGK